MMRNPVLLLLSLLLLISACGFQPLHGTMGGHEQAVEDAFSRIKIATIPDREGQYLKNALIDSLHRNGMAQDTDYVLNVMPITESLINLDITRESDTTRGQLNLRTSFTLSSTQQNEAVLTRNLLSTASYNILGSEFATRVSEENARQNALDELARQIEQQLALYFKRQ